MVNYTCLICLKEFHKKYNFEKHTLNKKNPCKPIIVKLDMVSTQNHTITAQKHTIIATNNEKLDNNFLNNENKNNIQSKSCLYCGMVFTRKDTVKRHVDKFCKVKKSQDDAKEKELDEKDKLISELSKKIDNLTKKIDNIIIKIDVE